MCAIVFIIDIAVQLQNTIFPVKRVYTLLLLVVLTVLYCPDAESPSVTILLELPHHYSYREIEEVNFISTFLSNTSEVDVHTTVNAMV
jgi:hypothetical protein